MAGERLSVFENTEDLDLSSFAPARAKKAKPGREQVKAVSEAARFPSREVPPPAPAPAERRPRYHKTGRTAPLSCRIMPATHDKIYGIADSQGWLVGYTIERALEALERELGEGETGNITPPYPGLPGISGACESPVTIAPGSRSCRPIPLLKRANRPSAESFPQI